jgi:hypothetical protein
MLTYPWKALLVSDLPGIKTLEPSLGSLEECEDCGLSKSYFGVKNSFPKYGVFLEVIGIICTTAIWG